jgi:cytidine deaminase
MMTESGKEMTMTSAELLPGAFNDSAMEKNNEL